MGKIKEQAIQNREQSKKDLEVQNNRDLIVLLATFKSFHEQLYNLKGVHSFSVKMYFNKLMNTARRYEKEINQKVNYAEEDLNKVYDNLTELIYFLREGYFKEDEKENG